MGYATCTVTTGGSSVSCNPDPVPVSRATQNGITWTFANAGYTFTGLLIDGVAAPTGDFGTPVIGSTNAGRSTMSVSDSVATLRDFKYTLEFTDPQGNAQQYDPTIRNNP